MARAATKKVTKTVAKKQPKEQVFYALIQNTFVRDRLLGLYKTAEAAREMRIRLEGKKAFSLSVYTIQEIKLTP